MYTGVEEPGDKASTTLQCDKIAMVVYIHVHLHLHLCSATILLCNHVRMYI